MGTVMTDKAIGGLAEDSLTAVCGSGAAGTAPQPFPAHQ